MILVGFCKGFTEIKSDAIVLLITRLTIGSIPCSRTKIMTPIKF
jgi:hypothetical protein